MNTNTQVYSYTKLIKGDNFSLRYHNQKINDIMCSGKESESLAYHKEQKEFFLDRLARYVLQRACVGDVVVLLVR